MCGHGTDELLGEHSYENWITTTWRLWIRSAEVRWGEKVVVEGGDERRYETSQRALGATMTSY